MAQRDRTKPKNTCHCFPNPYLSNIKRCVSDLGLDELTFSSLSTLEKHKEEIATNITDGESENILARTENVDGKMTIIHVNR